MSTQHKHGVLLTRREIEVVRLVAHGLSDAEIAEHLTIALYSVRTHMRNIGKALGVRRRSYVALYALKVGLVRLEDIELPGRAAGCEVAQ